MINFGMGLSYKGIRGCGPLIVSLANTKEVLYLVNRPGQAASHSGSVEWIDRAVKLVAPVAGIVTIRGDTDFTHTAHLDRWDKAGRQFILGMDAHPKVVQLAGQLPPSAWKKLERLPKYEILTEPRQKAFRHKEQIVIEKEGLPASEWVILGHFEPFLRGKTELLFWRLHAATAFCGEVLSLAATNFLSYASSDGTITCAFFA